MHQLLCDSLQVMSLEKPNQMVMFGEKLKHGQPSAHPVSSPGSNHFPVPQADVKMNLPITALVRRHQTKGADRLEVKKSYLLLASTVTGAAG